MGAFLGFFLALVVIAGVLFLIASFAFGRGEEMAAAPPDSTPVELPDDRPVAGDDVRDLRLSVTARGYRMGEVDWVLDQLARTLDARDSELADRDREIARLTALLPAPVDPPASPADPDPDGPTVTADPVPEPDPGTPSGDRVAERGSDG